MVYLFIPDFFFFFASGVTNKRQCCNPSSYNKQTKPYKSICDAFCL